MSKYLCGLILKVEERWFEAWNGCFLLLPNWHEMQVDVLLKWKFETGRDLSLTIRLTMSKDGCPNLKCHIKEVVLIPIKAVNVLVPLWRFILSRRGYKPFLLLSSKRVALVCRSMTYSSEWVLEWSSKNCQGKIFK